MDLIYLKSPVDLEQLFPDIQSVVFLCERSGGSEDQQKQDAAEPNSYKLTLIRSSTCFPYVNTAL